MISDVVQPGGVGAERAESALGALVAGLEPRSLAGSGFRLGRQGHLASAPSLEEGRGAGAGPPASPCPGRALSRFCAQVQLRSCVTADLEPVGPQPPR